MSRLCGRLLLRKAGILRQGAADAHAMGLALRVEAAHRGAPQITELAIDCSKCYTYLGKCSSSGPLPPRCPRRLVDAHGFPCGCATAAWWGPACVPVRGLAPGRPAATYGRVLLMHCWSRQVIEAAPRALPQDYVHDTLS